MSRRWVRADLGLHYLHHRPLPNQKCVLCLVARIDPFRATQYLVGHLLRFAGFPPEVADQNWGARYYTYPPRQAIVVSIVSQALINA